MAFLYRVLSAKTLQALQLPHRQPEKLAELVRDTHHDKQSVERLPNARAAKGPAKETVPNLGSRSAFLLYQSWQNASSVSHFSEVSEYCQFGLMSGNIWNLPQFRLEDLFGFEDLFVKIL